MTRSEAGQSIMAVLKDARLAWGVIAVLVATGWHARGVLNAQTALPARVSAIEVVQDHTSARVDTLYLRLDSADRNWREVRCLVKQLFEPQPDASRCTLLP